MNPKQTSQRSPQRLGSVQRRFVRLQGISSDVLVVGAPGTPAAYVGVLEVGGISYNLKSQREQERLMDLWQQILAGVTFPVQLLWRSLPLRLDPYLQSFQTASREQPTIWGTLVAAHVQHVRALAARRPLVQRRIYLLTRVNATEQGTRWPHGAVLAGAKARGAS
jgi:hypothetical protein